MSLLTSLQMDILPFQQKDTSIYSQKTLLHSKLDIRIDKVPTRLAASSAVMMSRNSVPVSKPAPATQLYIGVGGSTSHWRG